MIKQEKRKQTADKIPDDRPLKKPLLIMAFIASALAAGIYLTGSATFIGLDAICFAAVVFLIAAYTR